MKLRCRLHLHKWVRIKQPTGSDEEWRMECRYCHAPQKAGSIVSMGFFGVFALAAVAVFWFLSPLLGAVMMVGAMSGLMWAMGPPIVDRVSRWLSIGR